MPSDAARSPVERLRRAWNGAGVSPRHVWGDPRGRLGIFVAVSLLIEAAVLLEFGLWHWVDGPPEPWPALSPLVQAVLNAPPGESAAGPGWYHLRLTPLAVWLLGLIWAFAAWRNRGLRTGTRHAIDLALIAGLIFACDFGELRFWLSDTVITTEDTRCYWAFCPMRTAGYPALLHLFATFPDQFHDLVLFQFLAAAAATLLLCHAVLVVFRSTPMAFAIAFILCIKEGLIWQHLSLMTDSIFFSCCTAALGMALLIIQRPTWRLIAGTGIILGIAALVRPATLGLALPFAAIGLLLWRRRERRLAIGLLAALSCGLAINIVAHPITARIVGKPDAGAGDMAGYSLMATSGFLLTPETPTANPELRDRLVPETAPFRETWLQTRGIHNQFAVLLPQADEMLFGHVLRAACQVVQHPCRNPLASDVSRAMKSLAIETILHDPVGMYRIFRARIVDDARWSLSGDWQVSQQSAFATLNRTYAADKTIGKIFEARQYRLDPTAELIAPDVFGISSWVYGKRKTLNGLLLYTSLGSIGLLIWSMSTGRLGNAATALGIAGAGALFYNVLVSIAQAPFGRYTDAVTAWLLIVLFGGILLSARAILAAIGGYLRDRQPPVMASRSLAAGVMGSIAVDRLNDQHRILISPEMMNSSTISTGLSIAVVVPCYNEALTVGKVVTDFQAALPMAKIYVYDNNSTDETSVIAARAGAEVRSERLQGKGYVVQRMFADIDADIYVMVDGDDTYDAEDTARLVALLQHQTLDLVNGRRISEAEAAYRLGHRTGNRLLTGMVGFIFGNRLDDMLSGCKIMSRRFVKSFPALATGFEIETEIVVHALGLGMPLAEGPLRYRERPAGSTSKLSTYRDGLRILRLIFRLARLERPTVVYGSVGGLLAVTAMVLAFPLIGTFLETGLVPRLPTAVLASSLMLLAWLSLVCGLILESVTRSRREMRRLAYLQFAPVPRARTSGP